MVRRVVPFILVLALAAAGCAQGAGSGDDAGRIDVVAAFYPLAEAAERIGGDRVAVTNLTSPGAEPHDLELSTDQLDRVIDADVVLYLGHGFQPALEEALDDATGVVLDVLEGEDLVVGGGHAHDHADEDEEAFDPHVWLDPVRWSAAIDRIAEAMSGAVEGEDDGFATAAAEYRGAIDALDSEFEEGLADCEQDHIVTSHAAFIYMADRYGLHQESISGVSPEAEPDPQRLADLADLVAEEGVTTIFTETLVSPKVAETLAREAGVETAVLNPLEGLTEEQIDRDEDYISVMRSNLDALRDGLACR